MCVCEYGGGEEGVTAGWGGGEIGEAAIGDEDGVRVPEGKGGKVGGEDLLSLDVVGAADGLVGLGGGVVEEVVEYGVAVSATICALGGDAGGGEGVGEDVGLLVAANPAEGVELEAAAGEVLEEGGGFVGADLEIDADLGELLLECGGEEAGAFVGGGLHGEVEADAVGVGGAAGGVEKLAGAGEVVGVAGDVGGVGPVGGGEEAEGELGAAAEQGGADEFAVNGAGDGLADARVAEGWIGGIEGEVLDDGAGCGEDGKVGFAGEDGEGVGLDGVGGDVGGAFAELEGAGDAVGDDGETEVLDEGGAGGWGGGGRLIPSSCC